MRAAANPSNNPDCFDNWRLRGTTRYQHINSATTPLSEMQFGDVNGDGVTDVFTLKQRCTIELPLALH